MRIAITTPTGNIGRGLTQLLLDQGGHDLILLARRPERLADQQARGATVLQGDLCDAVFVREALAGAEALFFVCRSGSRPSSERTPS